MKLKENLSAKIAAIIFSYVMIIVLAFSLTATVVMGYYKFYFSSEDTVKKEILTDMAKSEAYYIHSLLGKETDLDNYYKDKNVFYRITYLDSGNVVTNYNNEPYIATESSEYYKYEENYYEDDNGINRWTETEIHIGTIEVFVAENMDKNDIFSVTSKIIEIGYSLRYAMVFIVLISLALEVFLLCYLFCAAGHNQGGVIRRNYLDMIPFDIITATVIIIAYVSLLALDGLVYDLTTAIIYITLIGSIDYFVALGYTMSFATRVKTRTLLKNTVIYYVLSFISKKLKKVLNWFKYIFSNISLIYKTLIIIAGAVIVEIIALIFIINTVYYIRSEILFFAIIWVNFVLILGALYLAVIMQKIKTGGERISQGDLQYKISTEYMVGDFKSFANSLNNINDGLQTAVNERMKSERFKTELITNVSHDIKTPLTSIINYVDLIKKQQPENENVRQYIEVLDRQSARLKKLVEDLVEASKASSGTLPVNLSPCDVGVLLTQTLGEFEDKLNKRQLSPVINIPKESVKILADGRHLWRIFDNLMSNVCKYALKGTRVYIDVKRKSNKAVITFRNISEFELNVTADELMERFVRGDESRNTEGSGLGISIAKSLAELQGGCLELCVDGDLFKATVVFDIV